MQSITYTNGSDNPSTADRTVTFTVTDEGNLTSDAATRDITVAAENDKPVVTPTVADLAYTENDGAVILEGDGAVALDGAITVADVDNANIKSAVIQITGNYVNGEDTLSFVDQNGITGTWTAATGTLTLTGVTTKANYQTALQSIAYTNGSDDPSTLDRTVTFTVTDESNLASDAATRDITVAGSSDAPAVTPTVADLSYTENDGAVAVDDAVAVADVDDANLEGAVIQITGNYVNGEDTLSFTDQNGITGTWTAATGTLELTGTATKAQYQTALRSITYTNASETPDTNTRTVTFTVNDGDADSAAETRDITIAAVNDTPVADDATFTIAEDAADGTVVGTVTATDLDTSDTLTFSITAGNDDGIFAIDGATGKIAIADKTKLDYEAAASHSLTVTVTDNGTGALTDTAAVTVNVTNINEAPLGEDAALTVAENSANGTLVGTVTATDPDVGDTLTYAITAGNDDGIFAIDSSTGKITVADGTKLDYETATTYTLTVQVKDAGELTDTLTAAVTVGGVNEEPSVNSYRFRVDENSAAGVRVGTVSASDPDAGDTLIYSIIAGNENDAFSIDPETGEISIRNSDALDFETHASFELTIQVTDSGSLSKTASVTIELNDVEEVVLVEQDPTAGTTDAGEFDDAATDTDTGTDTDQGKEDTEGPEREVGPVEDQTRHEDEAVSETEEALEETADTASESSLSDIPEAAKLYEEEAATDRIDRRDRTNDTGSQAGEKGQKGGESEGDAKQVVEPNELSGVNAGLYLNPKEMDRMSAQARKMLSDTHMQNQLDALKEQITREASLQQGDVKFMVGTASGVTATAVAGYMLWMFRGVSLIASAIASLPVWGFFDPLPVLSRWEKAPSTDGIPGEDFADESERRLDDIFKEKETAKKDKDKKKRKGKR